MTSTRSPSPAPVAPEPTFHAFAEQWWIEHEHEMRPKTKVDYRWRLENHLIPFFGCHTLRQITIAGVDRYKASKLRDGRLGPRSINMTLTLLADILEVAEERELVDRNTAKGKRRRVRQSKPRRSYLDTAEQITALLNAAGELDAEAKRYRHVQRRALLAVLLFAGLRIGELLDLRWGDVDLATGRIRVGRAKTDAGLRDVTLRPVLRDVLAALKASAPDAQPRAYVFAAETGTRRTAGNVRRRMLAKAVERANEHRADDEQVALPALTPHSLRRTFASPPYAIGSRRPWSWPRWGTRRRPSRCRSTRRRCAVTRARTSACGPFWRAGVGVYRSSAAAITHRAKRAA